jgi:aminoglycoside phosphotransferase (APT) family kinase protein
MARVAHPNVVAIYEVDEDLDLDRMYVVMEYVPGTNLRDWMSERPRSWREVRDVFLAAGCGLAAVHGAGVVHRDSAGERARRERRTRASAISGSPVCRRARSRSRATWSSARHRSTSGSRIGAW